MLNFNLFENKNLELEKMKIKYLENFGIEDSSYMELIIDFGNFLGYPLKKEKEIDYKGETYYLIFGNGDIGVSIKDICNRVIALDQRPNAVGMFKMYGQTLAAIQEAGNVTNDEPELIGIKDVFNPKENKLIYETIPPYACFRSTKYNSLFPMLMDYLERYHKILQEKKH